MKQAWQPFQARFGRFSLHCSSNLSLDDKKKGEIELINTHRISTTKSGKKLLLCCMLAMTIACSAAVLPSSHAFAATNPHASAAAAIKSGGSFDDFIWPAWNFLGCGTGWDNMIDSGLNAFKYSYTTGSRVCTSAVWNDSARTSSANCDIGVYIPTIFATAKIAYGIVDVYGTERVVINQNNVSGWQDLGWHLYVGYVYISSNNGQNGTDMAAGEMDFVCI
jgi:hypothetical protein